MLDCGPKDSVSSAIVLIEQALAAADRAGLALSAAYLEQALTVARAPSSTTVSRSP